MSVKKAPKVTKKDIPVAADNRSSLYISEKELAAIKDWKVGQKYKLEVEVEMTGISKQDNWGSDPGKLSANFKINKISTEKEK